MELAGKEYTARLYKLAVTGYEGRTNTLNLFDLDTIDELSLIHILLVKGDGIQAVYGPKADVLKSDINDIL